MSLCKRRVSVRERAGSDRKIQDQTLSSAIEFFGNSVGFLKERLECDRTQIQSLLKRLSNSQEEDRSQLQKLVGSYEDVEYILDLVIQKQGVEYLVEQTRETAEETPQAATESLPPGSTLLDESTDEQGRTVLRNLDESGNITETVLSQSGEAVSEEIVGVIADPNPGNGSG